VEFGHDEKLTARLEHAANLCEKKKKKKKKKPEAGRYGYGGWQY